MSVFRRFNESFRLLSRIIPEYVNQARVAVFSSSYQKKPIDRYAIKPEVYKSKEKDPHALRYGKPKLKFVAQGVDLTKYTHKPIPYPKTGGRNWLGRVANKRIGGGARQCYRMVDFTRNAISESEPREEKVISVRYDPLRSADIALVARENHKRWILASENMKPGDIIKSYGDIPKLPVVGKEGDAHPVGALPIGAVVHNVEKFPNLGGDVARAAGTSATVVGKQGIDKVILKMPSGREMCVDKTCVATVGRVSNVNNMNEIIGHPKRSRWFGIRPKSGLFKKKTGYHGRKIRPQKPLVTYEKKTRKLHEMFDA